MTIKTCTKCGESKSLEEFSFRTDTNTYRGECKACGSKRHNEYYREFIKREKVLNSSGIKTCFSCSIEKPYSEFGKKKIEKDGHNKRCKPCYKEYNRGLIARNKNKEKVLNSSGVKECLFCGEEKSYKEFGIKPETKDGYYVYCKECVNVSAKERRLENVDRNKGKEINLMETKYCSGCDTDKVKGDFNINIHGVDGLRNHCRECESTERKELYTKDPERYIGYAQSYQKANQQKVKRAARLRNYGLTPQDYEGLLRLQSGCCAICRDNTGKLMIDHCHICGFKNIKAVRGLLCMGCNSHSKFSLDNPTDMLRKATAYAMVHWNAYHRENSVGNYSYGYTKQTAKV